MSFGREPKIQLNFTASGYDTTGNSLGIGLWLLSLRPDLQEKLQAEIDEIVCQNEGGIDYAAIQVRN